MDSITHQDHKGISKESSQEKLDTQNGVILPFKPGDEVDVAAAVLANAQDQSPVTEEEMTKLRRKIDWRLTPMLFVCLQLSGWDKILVGTAAIYGMETDLGFTGSQYSWVGSIMYFAFLIAIFPTLWALQRFPTGKYLAANIFCWGVVEMCHAATKNPAGILVCRFLLGVFQCCDLPAMVIISTMWWKKSEQPLRIAIICSVTSSVGNGLISFGFSFVTYAHIAKWKLIFLAPGAFTVLYGTLMFFVLPNSPADCKWLSERERFVAVKRLRDEKLGVDSLTWKWHQAREAVLEKKNWILWLFFISVNIPNGGLISFSTIIIKSLGFTSRDSSLMTIPTGLVSTFSAWGFSWVAGRTKKYRTLVLIASLVIPLIGAIVVYATPRTNTPAQLIGLTCSTSTGYNLLQMAFNALTIVGYQAPYIVGLSMFQANTAGRSKKTTVNAMDYFAYAVGNIIGPRTFKSDQAPKYTGAIIAMTICYAVCMLLGLWYGFACYLENKKRDEELRVSGNELGADHDMDFMDLTDKENRSFRYTR